VLEDNSGGSKWQWETAQVVLYVQCGFQDRLWSPGCYVAFYWSFMNLHWSHGLLMVVCEPLMSIWSFVGEVSTIIGILAHFWDFDHHYWEIDHYWDFDHHYWEIDHYWDFDPLLGN
jgi:hypothetical protein